MPTEQELKQFLQSKGLDEQQVNSGIAQAIKEGIIDVEYEEQRNIPSAGTVTNPDPNARPLGPEILEQSARFGIPTIAAVGSANPLVIGGAAAGGELIAREIEEAFNRPEFTSWRDYANRKRDNALAAAVAGGTEWAGQKYLAPVISKIVRGFKKSFARPVRAGAVPTRLPEEIQTTQRVLGELGEANVRGKVMTRIAGPKNEPFSLTLDQIHREEDSLVSWFGSLVRSGLLSKRGMRKIDLRNLDALEDTVFAYLKKRASETTNAEFGDTLKGLITGEIDVIRSTRNAYWDAFRHATKDSGAFVDLSDLQDFLRSNMHRKDIKQVFTNIKDLTPKITEDWQQIDLADAVQIKETINSLVKNPEALGISKATASRVLGHAGKKVGPQIERTLSQVSPEAREAYQLANAYHGKTADLIDNDVMNAVKKKLQNFPAGVVSMFKGTPNMSYDRLLALEKLFTSKRPGGAGTSLSYKQFEESVLRPLRFSIMMEAFDREKNQFSGAFLAKTLDRLSAKGHSPEFLEKIFGYDSKVLQDLATSMKFIEAQKPGSNVMIQLMTGGTTMQAAMAAGQAFAGATRAPGILQQVAGQGAVILLTPLQLMKVMKNPRTVRLLTDGILEGPRTTAFSRAMSAVSNAAAESRFDVRSIPADALDFYTTPLSSTFFNLTSEETPQ